MSSQKAMINTLMFYHWDDTLFDGMHLPVGVDRDDVVKSILLETSDFPIIITDLPTLKLAIEIWSKHKVDIWEHLLATTRYIYNPIENYNRVEVETTHLEKRGTGSVKGDGGADTTTYNVSESGSVADSTRENETDSRTSTTNNVEAHSGEDVRNITETVNESNGGVDTRTINETVNESNGGTDNRAINETVTEVNSGDDGTSVTGTSSKTKTGTDELNSTENTTISHTGSDTVLEGVSAFNEQNVFSDHTRTETVFNSGETRNTTRDDVTTYDTTEAVTESSDTTVTYGKETDTTKTVVDDVSYGKETETTKTVSDGLSYGKETDTSTTSTERQSYGEEVETDTAISDSGSREKTGSLNRTLGNTKTGTETHTHSQGNIETRNFDDDFTAERHITGNIGVMTTQDMIKQEREIALFDIVDVIVADYKSEFCILIY